MNQLNKDPNRPPAPDSSAPPMVRVQTPAPVAPYVTYVIIAVTILTFLLQNVSERDLLIEYGALNRDAVLAGELWRFITPAFLHWDGVHILFNMYALFSLGTGLERYFGHGRFMVLYVLGAFTGNVVSFLFSREYDFSAGASTAVFGLLGAEATFLFMNRKLLAGQFSRAIQNVIFIAIVNLILGQLPGIDNWAHVGGLLGGLMFTWFAGPVWKIEGTPPLLHMVDQRSTRDVIVGAATTVLVFGALAMWGMTQ